MDVFEAYKPLIHHGGDQCFWKLSRRQYKAKSLEKRPDMPEMVVTFTLLIMNPRFRRMQACFLDEYERETGM
jgi:hypothetical protein